jgi:hypothetical protein
MSDHIARPRGARLGRVLLAGAIVVTYGTAAWDTPHAAEPIQNRVDTPRPHWSVDGGGPAHLTPPRAALGPAEAVSEPDAAPAAPAGPELGIPDIVLNAYRQAGNRAAQRESSCHLPWQLLAAIGKVESNHAENGAVDTAGTATRPILGPALDGSNGYAAIPSGQPGSRWARAIGPMQFIPSTWNAWAADGNGDGTADPENVYDATAAAADYLCANGRDMSTSDGLRSAILSYNNDPRYLVVVSQWYAAYSAGVVAAPDNPDTPQAQDVAVVEPATAPAAPAPPPATAQEPAPAPAAPTPPPARPTPTPPSPSDPVRGLVAGVTGTVTGVLTTLLPATGRQQR